jgi:hypothetical protein
VLPPTKPKEVIDPVSGVNLAALRRVLPKGLSEADAVRSIHSFITLDKVRPVADMLADRM